MRAKKLSLQHLFFIGMTLMLGSTLFLHLFPFSKLHTVSFRQYPEEYMRRVALTQYSELGVPQNQLKADYWGYIGAEKKSKLLEPHLTVHKTDGSTWQIDAKQGHIHHPTLHHSIEKIELWDQVVIERLANQKITPIKLETSALQYQPQKEYLETEQMVTVTKPNVILTATGLRAFFANSWIELLSNVKTKYTIHP